MFVLQYSGVSCLAVVSVVVGTRLKVIKAADGTDACFYLTNTPYTQVYCTGKTHVRTCGIFPLIGALTSLLRPHWSPDRTGPPLGDELP